MEFGRSNTITVSVPEGYQITKIVFAFTTEKSCTLLYNTTNLADQSKTWTATDPVYTVTFKAGKADGSTGGRIDLTQITVSYKSTEAPCTHAQLTKTTGTPAECEKTGLADYWTCDECQRMFSKGENPTDEDEVFYQHVLDALEHSFTDWQDDGDGLHHTATCDNCHTEKKQEEHDKEGEGGKCSKCGAEVTGDIKEKLTATFTYKGSKNPGKVDFITITAAQSDGINPPVVSSDGYRCYAKNTITFTADAGYSITEIEVTIVDKNGNKAVCSVTVDSGKYTTPSTYKGSWTGSANSVKFTLGDSGQYRMESVVVTYIAD